MERIKEIKDRLINTVQNQLMLSMDQVNTKELGEVVDMIKDLEECLYYCVLVKRMEEQGYEYPQQEMMYHMHEMQPMYYSGSGSSSGSSGSRGSGGRSSSSSNNGYNASARGNNARGFSEMEPYMMQGYNSFYPAEIRDFREGRSPMNRRSYMESKERTTDKNAHMQELDRYLQELATDINEMISDSSSEEKNLLQQKLTTLANKIKQQ